MKWFISLLVCIAAAILYTIDIEVLKNITSTYLTQFKSQASQSQTIVKTNSFEGLAPSDLPATPSNMSVPRAIRQAFLAVEQSEGAGARVRRSIGTPKLRSLNPFLMLDHFAIRKFILDLSNRRESVLTTHSSWRWLP